MEYVELWKAQHAGHTLVSHTVRHREQNSYWMVLVGMQVLFCKDCQSAAVEEVQTTLVPFKGALDYHQIQQALERNILRRLIPQLKKEK